MSGRIDTDNGTETLDQVIIERGIPARCLMVPFEASWHGERVIVTGVLDRTAVVHAAAADGSRPDERRVVRRTELVVDGSCLRWRELASPQPGTRNPLRLRVGPLRCSGCGRTSAEVAFRAYRATYCITCSRLRQRVYNQRQRRAA